MVGKLSKKWGPWPARTVITTDLEEAQGHKSPVLVDPARYQYLVEAKYLRPVHTEEPPPEVLEMEVLVADPLLSEEDPDA